jgi:hypothetical protein
MTRVTNRELIEQVISNQENLDISMSVIARSLNDFAEVYHLESLNSDLSAKIVKANAEMKDLNKAHSRLKLAQQAATEKKANK